MWEMIVLLNPTIQVALGGGTLFEWNCTMAFPLLSYPDLTVHYHPHLYFNKKILSFTQSFTQVWKTMQINRYKMEFFVV